MLEPIQIKFWDMEYPILFFSFSTTTKNRRGGGDPTIGIKKVNLILI